jgi:signal transduction histidine kinase
MNADNSLGIEFRYDGKILWHKAPTDLKLNLYRICQEQLTNIRKYAYATTVIVELELKHPLFRMTICDNGVGFDINKGKGGIGLHNMKKRAESFSGTLVVDSSPGNGCAIHVEIPITTICEC